MQQLPKRKYVKRIVLYTAFILFLLFILLLIFVDRLIEPILKDRLRTLIVQGSDSLYTYKLGKLSVQFFGGNVEVENLQITVDSNRYSYLRTRNALPSLTMQLNLGRGNIKGIDIMSLLFGKEIKVEEILSKDANIRLSRHIIVKKGEEHHQPVWKALRPKIERITVGKIRFEGIKLLYKNIDTSETVKLKFERCDAVFRDIIIDSLSSVDTSRIGFTKSISMSFGDLKFRTEDSAYKMKAKLINYSSDARSLEVDSFKLQPTLEKDEIYARIKNQKSLYYAEFDKVRFINIRLDHFIYNNIIDADSVIFNIPEVSIYSDRSLPGNFDSKIGKYPQQQLLKSNSTIIVKNLVVNKAHFDYTEKDGKTLQEGILNLDKMRMIAHNVTNDSLSILKQDIMTADLEGYILGSPLSANFKFYLDSSNGFYDATGSVKSIFASQLNPISIPLANVKLNSFNLTKLDFHIKGQDYEAVSDVRMIYNNLSITIRKTDKETGKTTTKKFLTKVLNKFVIWPENPGSDGVERISRGKRVARLTTEAFFGLLWKTIFAGMEDIMMRSGRYE